MKMSKYIGLAAIIFAFSPLLHADSGGANADFTKIKFSLDLTNVLVQSYGLSADQAIKSAEKDCATYGAKGAPEGTSVHARWSGFSFSCDGSNLAELNNRALVNNGQDASGLPAGHESDGQFVAVASLKRIPGSENYKYFVSTICSKNGGATLDAGLNAIANGFAPDESKSTKQAVPKTGGCPLPGKDIRNLPPFYDFVDLAQACCSDKAHNCELRVKDEIAKQKTRVVRAEATLQRCLSTSLPNGGGSKVVPTAPGDLNSKTSY